MVNTNGVLGLGVVKGFHNAFFTAAPRLRISANSFWACSSNSRYRSMARLKPAISSSLVFPLDLIIYYSPFRIANITLCIDICKKVNEKAANDCSLAAVW